ncbi:partitioning defective protein 6 [Halyomorpha halys]|uniref:partitioning defective protein 6 n=1 Tax=Halyomorpha halys TaxID=286706 RepID=UPI0006D4C9F7|nr:partitioning defective protein 6-like [Halyomorpha halys]
MIAMDSEDRVAVKSKIDAEFRRFSILRNSKTSYDDFTHLTEEVHNLVETPFLIFYIDPCDGDLLPINNDENFLKALQNTKQVLRIIIQRRGETLETNCKERGIISTLLRAKRIPNISAPKDFREVSSIIDIDLVPKSCRRIRLKKHSNEQPLGFYIRDGVSYRITSQGLESVCGVFISRLVPGGLAAACGLLAVGDEVLEVNGIEVDGKSLDQVTDMMVANASNLVITVKPAGQANSLS